MSAAPAAARTAERRAFYDRLKPHAMAPLWEVLHALVRPEPKTPVQPVRWRYDEVRPYVLESGALITAEEAERRVLILENPGLPGQSAITQSLYAGLQLILPGEIAPSHRHAQCALRFIMEGRGAYTAVDGERAIMAPFDLILTPNWQWHDHGNQAQEPTIWLDGLDIPMVRFLDASFAQKGNAAYQLDSRPPGDALARYGTNMLPVGFARTPHSPVFAYPYAQWRDALERMRRADAWDPCHGLFMEFINPADGGPMMPTISGFVQLLPRGFDGATWRATDGRIFVVVEGSGRAQVGDVAYDLGVRDIFVVPSWHAARFTAATDLVLFSFSDRGVQQKLHLWREERPRPSP